MSALLRGAMKTGYDEIAMKAGRIPMKQLSLALFLLLAAAAAAGDAALPERIGARRDRAGNILLGSALIRKSDRTISFPGRINIREGVIEVLVSTSRGRMHESLIVTDLDPFQLQMALILAGYGNGDRKTGASFHIEVVWGKSVRTPVDEWLYDNTAKQPKTRGRYFFAGSSFKNGQCLASLEGNLININSMDRNTILNADMDKDAALHEYTVRAEKLPPAKLKNADSPLEGREKVPVRVILIPADGKPNPSAETAQNSNNRKTHPPEERAETPRMTR